MLPGKKNLSSTDTQYPATEMLLLQRKEGRDWRHSISLSNIQLFNLRKKCFGITFYFVATIGALTACSPKTDQPAQPPLPSKAFTSVVGETFTGSIKGAWQGALSPLEDLNIKRQPIPEILEQIVSNPYAMPVPVNCPVISSEILNLNMLLGADIGPDAQLSSSFSSWRDISIPQWRNRGIYMEQGSKLVQDKASDFARNAVNIIPYRGWVRKLSGADTYTKKVALAYEAGKLRRAFLKGIGINFGCWYGSSDWPLRPAYFN